MVFIVSLTKDYRSFDDKTILITQFFNKKTDYYIFLNLHLHIYFSNKTHHYSSLCIKNEYSMC